MAAHLTSGKRPVSDAIVSIFAIINPMKIYSAIVAANAIDVVDLLPIRWRQSVECTANNGVNRIPLSATHKPAIAFRHIWSEGPSIFKKAAGWRKNHAPVVAAPKFSDWVLLYNHKPHIQKDTHRVINGGRFFTL